MAHQPRSPASPRPAPADEPAVAWAPCPTCWGQRRILEPARNGEGVVAIACPGCLGVGERPAAASSPPR